jgi:hypothetical protein
MTCDTAQLNTLVQALAQAQISLRPSGLERTCRCTACRTHVRPGQGTFIDAPAAFLVAQQLGSHLCSGCADHVRARAATCA